MLHLAIIRVTSHSHILSLNVVTDGMFALGVYRGTKARIMRFVGVLSGRFELFAGGKKRSYPH